jgi:hypothetical protein
MHQFTKKIIRLTFALLVLSGCNIIMITPHSKKQQQHAKPSMLLIEDILEFREKNNSWPISKVDFASKSDKYKQAINAFPYLNIQFKIVEQDKMIFYFDSHIFDVENQRRTKKIDLNAYGGEVRFFKEKGKFLWKTKMY